MSTTRSIHKQHRFATRSVRGGQERSRFAETSEALYLSSGFVYESAEEAEAVFAGEKDRFRYGRIGSPTVTMFEKRLALMEGAKHCHAVASGMSATFVVLTSLVKQGDRIVAGRDLFSSSTEILRKFLPQWGISCTFVAPDDMDAWRQALSQPATAVLIETPSNPLLGLTDIEEVAKLAHQAGAKVIVDNVFATPIFQSSLELGADIVYYSATKHIDGQGRVLGGAILHNDDAYANDVLHPYIYHTGAILSPFNSWVLLKGLETLELRVKAQTIAAGKIATKLENHPAIRQVYYPGLSSHPQHALALRQMSGFGTMLALSVKGGKAAAFSFLNNLKVVDICNNLGDSKSLATHPATTTHYSLTDDERKEQGLDDSHIRLSVGLEDQEDLIEDIEQAL